jgi:hypothetical protein
MKQPRRLVDHIDDMDDVIRGMEEKNEEIIKKQQAEEKDNGDNNDDEITKPVGDNNDDEITKPVGDNNDANNTEDINKPTISEGPNGDFTQGNAGTSTSRPMHTASEALNAAPFVPSTASTVYRDTATLQVVPQLQNQFTNPLKDKFPTQPLPFTRQNHDQLPLQNMVLPLPPNSTGQINIQTPVNTSIDIDLNVTSVSSPAPEIIQTTCQSSDVLPSNHNTISLDNQPSVTHDRRSRRSRPTIDYRHLARFGR